jgi:hypothetical protein
MSAYQMVKDAVASVLPEGWKFTAFEPLEDMPDVTGVTMKIRTVTRLPTAPLGAFQVDWILTVTSPNPSRETADPSLYDDLIDFLGALDKIGTWLGWVDATKTVGDDLARLAYDITVRTLTTKAEA